MVYYMMCTPVVGMAGPQDTEEVVVGTLMDTQALAQLMTCTQTEKVGTQAGKVGTQTGEAGIQGGSLVGEADSQLGQMGIWVVHIVVELMYPIPEILQELWNEKVRDVHLDTKETEKLTQTKVKQHLCKKQTAASYQ